LVPFSDGIITDPGALVITPVTTAISGASTAQTPVGAPITLNSTTTDTAEPGGPFAFSWEVTKTQASGTAVLFQSQNGSASSFQFTPDAAGTYLVTLVATDPGGRISNQASQAINVSQASQTIAFAPLSPVIYGIAPPISLSAIGGDSGNPVTFTVISGPGTLSANVLTVTGAGDVVLEADQAGNANYAAAGPVRQTLHVYALNPTGGLSTGFWANQNGQALETLTEFSALTGLTLRTASGASEDFAATGSTALATDKASLATWLKGATATNMAYMLSAQLAATELAVLSGFVNASGYVDLNLISGVYNSFGSSSALMAAVNTSPYGALTDANGIVQIQAVMNAAKTVLGTAAGSNAVAGSLLRSYEEALKDILDAINNNQLIVVV
jgi:hypothetical protein